MIKFPEEFRWSGAPCGYGSRDGDRFGAFRIPRSAANGRLLLVMAVDGAETGWEHVSVSLIETPQKCPSWEEMCAVKRLFWEPEDCVVQFHPPESEYVNNHPGVLHLWRCVVMRTLTPPKVCV